MSKKILKKLLFFLFLGGIPTTNAQEELRAPAYPLVTHNPYASIWSMGNELNASPTKHWTGQEHSLTGLVKVDGELYRFLGMESIDYETLLPASDEASYEAVYTETEPVRGWEQIGFDDDSWRKGAAPFSDDREKAKTLWESENLWFRREFDLKETDLESLYLKLWHDDNVVAYLNGEKIYEFNGWKDSYKYIPVAKSIIGKLKKKGNVLAIHIKNTGGGRWLDAGLVTETESINEVEVRKAEQTDVSLNANQTIYTFNCGGIELTATFTSPLLMKDIELLSRPVSYISVKTQSRDAKAHEVALYLGVSSSLAVNSPSQEVQAWKYQENGLNILKTGTTEQPVLERKGDDVRIDWGYAYIATPESNTDQYISSSPEAISSFASGNLPLAKKEMIGKNLVLSSVADMGTVQEEKEQVFLLGYDELVSVQYFDTKLEPWWKKNADSMEALLAVSYEEYEGVIDKVEVFDAQLYKEAKLAGGEKYAELCELAYRQAIAAHTLVEAPSGEILFLSKENHSNGSINTVDITYPSAPLFLIYNPDLVKGMLNGIFHYSESGRWKKPFPAHDLGTYPIATGQTYGEDMPVEEAGNVILLTAAIAQEEGNAEYARKHWKVLSLWANYLMENGFDPENQLSTDDFAGHLARNANLSVKAILALASYGKLAGMLGDSEAEAKYTSAAEEMSGKWMELANDGDHYSLAFEHPGTWSQKYNLAWDSILNLNIFPESVREKEMAYYLKNQKKYGLPLDSRENYTKSDWVLWTATLTEDQDEFKALVHPIWDYANETKDRVPVSDWHDTKDAHVMNFKARSVVGGYFMKLLKWKSGNKE